MRLTPATRPSRTTTPCVLHAPAKLNLCLELLGKREDGFHELRTVMTTVRLADTLRVGSLSDSRHIGLEIDPASPRSVGVPTDRSNLIVRALELLQSEADVSSGATVRLFKRIPSQAGLGGGSSDAAAALIAGNRVWGLGWPIERLSDLAARLGSDIPFFVHALADPRSRAARAEGRGERITPVQQALSSQPVVILKPAEGLSTAQVFSRCQPGDYGSPEEDRCRSVAQALSLGSLTALAGGLANHLQAAAMRVAPWLSAVRERFDSAGCAVHQLSGSGSAYFGLTRTPREARRLAARLRALRVGQVYTTAFG